MNCECDETYFTPQSMHGVHLAEIGPALPSSVCTITGVHRAPANTCNCTDRPQAAGTEVTPTSYVALLPHALPYVHVLSRHEKTAQPILVRSGAIQQAQDAVPHQVNKYSCAGSQNRHQPKMHRIADCGGKGVDLPGWSPR